MARLHTAVTPSGVTFTVRSLVGDDQAMLTSMKNSRDGSGFNKMLAGAIKQVGDVTLVTEQFIERMLSNDRKYILVQLRQFSLGFMPSFDFKFDWPIADGGTRKELQEYSVEFNEEDFKAVPYIWVAEAVAARNAQEKAENLEPTKEWPELYTSYEEMLAEQLHREYTTPYSQELIKWQLLTGGAEKRINAIAQDNRTSSTPLAMRKPIAMLQPTDPEADPIPSAWQVGKADLIDVEGFRKETRRVEGHIDTILTIQHQTAPDRQTRVDLVGTVDFFFPSQAI